MIIKPNEARRKLDMEDAEGGDVLLANGSIVPLTMAGAAYLKGESEPDETKEPEQPEEENRAGHRAAGRSNRTGRNRRGRGRGRTGGR